MITFTSDAGASVMMFNDVGQRMLETIGKHPDQPGVVAVDQLPAAIAALRAAAEADKIAQRSVAEEDRPRTEAAPGGSTRPFVSFYQRAVPLLELLSRAAQRGKPVFWSI